MSKLEEFQERASDAFAFLSHEYGFTCEQRNSQAAESYRRYERKDMIVTVNYALGDEVWVAVSFPARGQRTSLKKLARDSAIVADAPEGGTLREQVERAAAQLRAYLDTTPV